MDPYLFTPISRAVDQFTRVMYVMWELMRYMFSVSNDSISNSGWAALILNTIRNSPYLLVGVILLVCGFVIGLLKRMITG